MNHAMHVKFKIMSLSTLLLIFLLAACGGRTSQQKEDSNVTITLTAESTQRGQTELLITVKDDADNPIDDATLTVRGEMTHAGMPPVLAEGVRDGQNGVYTVPFEWTMGGDWVVTVDVTLVNGRIISHQFDLSVTN